MTRLHLMTNLDINMIVCVGIEAIFEVNQDYPIMDTKWCSFAGAISIIYKKH